uniref:Uncharacterized protein n=1 Tax=Oryza rufipogon TaxID=4529 RepID=A0A0E0PC83_ORYRU
MLIHRFAASTHCLHFGSDLNIGDHHSKRATISSTQHCLHLILRLRPLSSSYLCCSNTRKHLRSYKNARGFHLLLLLTLATLGHNRRHGRTAGSPAGAGARAGGAARMDRRRRVRAGLRPRRLLEAEVEEALAGAVAPAAAAATVAVSAGLAGRATAAGEPALGRSEAGVDQAAAAAAGALAGDSTAVTATGLSAVAATETLKPLDILPCIRCTQ